jgi:uncharacterized coiled-coil protein SlyX
MTYDSHAATATITEQYATIDRLRHELAQERELADQLQYSLNALMKDYISKDLDPRTDEAIRNALAAFRDQRNYPLTN